MAAAGDAGIGAGAEGGDATGCVEVPGADPPETTDAEETAKSGTAAPDAGVGTTSTSGRSIETVEGADVSAVLVALRSSGERETSATDVRAGMATAGYGSGAETSARREEDAGKTRLRGVTAIGGTAF